MTHFFVNVKACATRIAPFHFVPAENMTLTLLVKHQKACSLTNQQKCACDAEHVKCQNPRCSCEDHLLDNENYEKALQPLSLSEVNKNAKCVGGAGSRCKSCQDPLFKNMILFFKLDSAKQAALDKLNLSCTRY